MLAVHGGLFQTVRQHATNSSTPLQRATHGGLIDALGATGDKRSACPSSEPANCHGVVDEGVVHMPRSDDGKPTGFEQSHVATAVEHCRRIFAQAGLQATRILGVGATDHPNGARLPALDHLAQQESAPQQFLQAALVNHRLARTQDLSCIRREEIRRLTLDLAQMTRETFVFTWREQIR